MSQKLIKSQTRFLQQLGGQFPSEGAVKPRGYKSERQCVKSEFMNGRSQESNRNCNHVQNFEKGDNETVENCDVIFQNYQELHVILNQILRNSMISSETKKLCANKLDGLMKKMETEGYNIYTDDIETSFNVNVNASPKKPLRSADDPGEGTSRSPKKSPRKRRSSELVQNIDITFRDFNELQKVMYKVFRNDKINIHSKKMFVKTLYEMFKLMKRLLVVVYHSGSIKGDASPPRSTWRSPIKSGMSPGASYISSTTSISDTNLNDIDQHFLKALFNYFIASKKSFSGSSKVPELLEYEDVEMALHVLNPKWPSKQVKDAFKKVDKDGTGQIDFVAFTILVQVINAR